MLKVKHRMFKEAEAVDAAAAVGDEGCVEEAKVMKICLAPKPVENNKWMINGKQYMYNPITKC